MLVNVDSVPTLRSIFTHIFFRKSCYQKIDSFLRIQEKISEFLAIFRNKV